jgi:hypothetical protein
MRDKLRRIRAAFRGKPPPAPLFPKRLQEIEEQPDPREAHGD